MNCDIHLTDKLAVYKRELDKMGVRVVAPCVNASDAQFKVRDQAVVYALGALKNVGVEAMRLIVEARGDKPFVTLFDFARRTDLKRVGKRPLEMLARAGAFDQLDPNRARVFEALDALVAYSAAIHEAKASSQVSLFGEAGADIPEPRIAGRDDWLPVERLAQEHQAVGFYLSGHPLDDYEPVLKRLRVERWADFARAVKKGASSARLAATVLDRQERRTKSGNKMGIVTLSDPSGQYEAIMFQEALNQYRDMLEKGSVVLVTLQAAVEGEDVRARIVTAEPLEKAANRVQKGLRIFLRDETALPSIQQRLTQRGEGEVSLVLMMDAAASEIEVKLPGRFSVSPQIAGALKAVPGIVAVEHV